MSLLRLTQFLWQQSGPGLPFRRQISGCFSQVFGFGFIGNAASIGKREIENSGTSPNRRISSFPTAAAAANAEGEVFTISANERMKINCSSFMTMYIYFLVGGILERDDTASNPISNAFGLEEIGS